MRWHWCLGSEAGVPARVEHSARGLCPDAGGCGLRVLNNSAGAARIITKHIIYVFSSFSS